MPDYKNGKIYKIWSPEGNDIYIGATTQALYKRFHAHKTRKECSSKLLFEKYTDVRIELLECCPCDNKEELTKKEGEYIRNTNCINRRIAGRTQKEYYEDNKEKIKERHKKYDKERYENNKEKILEQNSQKYNCECGRTFRIGDKAKHKRTLIHCNWVRSAGSGSSEPETPCMTVVSV